MAAILLSGLTSTCFAAASEYEIKAVFVLNFTHFIAWPEAVMPPQNGPLTIGVVGEDPTGPLLDAVVQNETVNGRSITVKRFSRTEPIDACHILYICRSEAARIPAILEKVKGRPIATVSDVDGFARNGGIIELAMENGKVRLRINVANAKNARLAMSANLLRPAQVIDKNEPMLMIRPFFIGSLYAGMGTPTVDRYRP